MLSNIKKNIFLDKEHKVKIISNPSLFSKLDKAAISQLYNLSTLPNIFGEVIGLPDLHIGYGMPIGSAFATSLDNSPIISPEATGYDIGCGISLVRTALFADKLSAKDYIALSKSLTNLSLGLSNNGINLSNSEFQELCYQGLEWAYKNNYASKFDKLYTEQLGVESSAGFSQLSRVAVSRGIKQVGTLGLGNHFLDLLVVDRVFDKDFCKAHKLSKGQLLLMLHSGSRGFGHQIAKEYIAKCTEKNPISYFDFYSKEGQGYYASMCSAGNFAFVNRAVLRSKAIHVIEKTLNLGQSDLSPSLLCDTTHNYASLETHKKSALLVHRKGAVRCFLPNELSSNSRFSGTGAPLVLPGSMLDKTYVLLPTSKVEKETFSTIAHGCGRQLSRKDARQAVSAFGLRQELLKKGVYLSSHSENNLREEQPSAYKPSSQVVDSLVGAGLCKKVFSLSPKVVVTG